MKKITTIVGIMIMFLIINDSAMSQSVGTFMKDSAKAITSDSLVVYGHYINLVNSGNNTKARVFYGTTTAVLSFTNPSVYLVAGDGTFAIGVGGLIPGQKYYFRPKITYPFSADSNVNDSIVMPTCNYTSAVSPIADTICAGASVQLIANVSGATSPSYLWSPSTGLSNANIANPIANPNATTTYTLKVTDAGCSESVSAKIVVQTKPNVTASVSGVSCAGGYATLNGSGSSVTTWQWVPATGLDNPNVKNPHANPTIATSYYVIGTNAGGCSDTSSTVMVSIGSLPIITITATSLNICSGASSTLNVSGASTYAWSSGLGAGSSKVVTPTIPTIYTVTGTSSQGCTNSNFIAIGVNPAPVITVSAASNTVCQGGSVQINASGATSYDWSPASSLLPSIGSVVMATPTATTVYTVTGTTGGCTATATEQIVVTSTPGLQSETYYAGMQMVIFTGVFPSPIEMSIGSNVYSATQQNGTQAVFTVSLNSGDQVHIYPIGAPSCATVWNYTVTGIEEYVELQKAKEGKLKVFNMMGQEITASFISNEGLVSHGIYLIKIDCGSLGNITRKEYLPHH
jgi:hypothetical protein